MLFILNFFESATSWLGACTSVGLLACMFAPILGMILRDTFRITQPDEYNKRLAVQRYLVIRLLLPVIVFYHLPRRAWWIGTVAIPASAVFLARIGKHWFRIVHSDMRVLCMADAFLFVGIGTLVARGPILVWMVAGGAFGVLNYRVVSIRWLKLVPVQPKE